jgi:hypothetical protein
MDRARGLALPEKKNQYEVPSLPIPSKKRESIRYDVLW